MATLDASALEKLTAIENVAHGEYDDHYNHWRKEFEPELGDSIEARLQFISEAIEIVFEHF